MFLDEGGFRPFWRGDGEPESRQHGGSAKAVNYYTRESFFAPISFPLTPLYREFYTGKLTQLEAEVNGGLV